jgi:hypothetical protein
VPGFDHHCKLLNNCIGSQNYKQFIALVTLYLVYTVVCGAIAILMQNFNALGIVSVAVHAVRVILLGALLIWHVFMACIGQTTYGYLTELSVKRGLKDRLARGEINVSEYN